MFKEWIVNNVASIKLHLWIIHILTFNRPARLVFFVVFFYYYKMLHIKSRRQPGRLWRRREGGREGVLMSSSPPARGGFVSSAFQHRLRALAASTSLLSSLPPTRLLTLWHPALLWSHRSGLSVWPPLPSPHPPRACSRLLTKTHDPFIGFAERQGGAWRKDRIG